MGLGKIWIGSNLLLCGIYSAILGHFDIYWPEAVCFVYLVTISLNSWYQIGIKLVQNFDMENGGSYSEMANLTNEGRLQDVGLR
jgi:hypothetical protein